MFQQYTKVCASILLNLSLVAVSLPANAQFAETEMIRQLHLAQSAMKEYGSSHDHYPNGVSEFDDCLKMLRKKVSLSAVDSTVNNMNRAKVGRSTFDSWN